MDPGKALINACESEMVQKRDITVSAHALLYEDLYFLFPLCIYLYGKVPLKKMVSPFFQEKTGQER